jgi:hypothetical protein
MPGLLLMSIRCENNTFLRTPIAKYMESRAAFFLLMLLTTSQYVCGQEYQIQRAELKNIGLTKAIRDYYKGESDVIDNVKGVVIVRYVKAEPEKFFLAFKVYKHEVLEDPPSFYAIVDGRFVLFYTGLEQQIVFTDKSFRQLFKAAKGRLTQQDVVYHPTVWEVDVNSEHYVFKIVSSLPW